MKGRGRCAGLTLLEAITVIAIVAVILGLLFPATNHPRTQARRAAAGTMVRNIVAALKAYQNDYGHFPKIAKPGAGGKFLVYVGDPACTMSENSNGAIFDVLRAIPRGPNANHALNAKREIYFEAATAKDPKNPRDGFADGPEFPEKDQGCLFDPWGRQYCIVFTTDGSGELDLRAVYADLAGPEKRIHSPVAAFSLGDDGIVGGKQYAGRFHPPSSTSPPSDIVSWQ